MGLVSFFREEFLNGLLGIPDGVRPVAWLCIGPVEKLQEVPDLERHGWRDRLPLEEVVHSDIWGRKGKYALPSTHAGLEIGIGGSVGDAK